MGKMSAIDRLKVVGLSAALALPIYWIYYFLSGIILVSIFKMEGNTYGNIFSFYFPLVTGIILLIAVYMLIDGKNDIVFVRMMLCVAIWLISIPISACIILLFEYSGSFEMFSEAGLLVLLKTNIISFIFTVTLALFLPIKSKEHVNTSYQNKETYGHHFMTETELARAKYREEQALYHNAADKVEKIKNDISVLEGKKSSMSSDEYESEHRKLMSNLDQASASLAICEREYKKAASNPLL